MIGIQIGVYKITSLLGSGGMGEVYRAHDAKLGRDVAIKVLPPAFANDADRLARFSREARLLAALNHPNIAHIYGLEEGPAEEGPAHVGPHARRLRAIVMELVEGPTLQEKIERGMPLDEILVIARQIAEALEAAHDKGIVHRDLKPANIKISPAGPVKVLDFGLAKCGPGGAGGSGEAGGPEGRDVSQLPTLTFGGTREGVILGTPAYMSPEQARGQAIDKRTDIWAFGCVLYEMLTGRVAFPGKTLSDTIAAILEHEPEWTALPPNTPVWTRRLLRRCLDKDPKRRLRDIGDAWIDIDEARRNPEADGPAAQRPAGSRRGLAPMLIAVTLALVVGATAVWFLRPSAVAPETRLEITTPPTRDPSLAISPDGRSVVFVAWPTGGGASQLWLRPLNAPAARPLAGTERALSPFWSPDSRSIAFFADAKLKRMDIDGGSVKTLAAAYVLGFGGAWNSDGTILFSKGPGNPIYRISADGGEPTAATRLESPQQRSQSSPRFLPDGRHFLFFVTGSPEAQGVYMGHLGGVDAKRLFDADASAEYGAGHLLFVRERKLLAQTFDPDRLELKGEPSVVADQASEGTALSASAAGSIVYRTLSADNGQRQFVWVDRAGRETDKVIYQDTASQGPALSRDGRRLAVFRYANGNMDIWLYDTGRRAWDRVTFAAGDEISPVWSPDGAHMVFASSRSGVLQLYRKLLSGPPGSEELLLSTPRLKFPTDWSADGRFLLYDELDPLRRIDIWALPLQEGGKPFVVVNTDYNDSAAQFSPDGRWIAYQSDRTGRFEIYVRPFPGPGGDLPVSTHGGAQARWNPNGKELFFVAADDRLMAVPVRFPSSDTPAELGTPVSLFATNVGSAAESPSSRQQYVVSPDGQSFVMNSMLEGATTSPITVILNWKPTH